MLSNVKRNVLTIFLAVAVFFGFSFMFAGCGTEPSGMHRVTFMSGEGENATVLGVINTNGGEELTLPDIPLKQGFEPNDSKFYYKTTVDGFETDYDFTKDTLKEKLLTEDMIVYAKYFPIVFRVHYIVEGTDVTEGVTDTRYLNSETTPQLNAIYYTASETDLSLPTPQVAGKTFVGWYFTSTYDQKITKLNAGSTGDVVLYAKFVDE